MDGEVAPFSRVAYDRLVSPCAQGADAGGKLIDGLTICAGESPKELFRRVAPVEVDTSRRSERSRSSERSRLIARRDAVADYSFKRALDLSALVLSAFA
jgi:hypothetical protein